MSKNINSPSAVTSRRRFLQTIAVAVAAVPMAGLVVRQVHAQDLTPLDGTNPTAAALGYVDDSGTVDAAKYPQHKAEQNCTNCQFYTAVGADSGSCQLFPGYSVKGKGWCASWAAKNG